VPLDLLVVDDSPVTRKMVRRAITACGLEVGTVHEAENGAAALATLGAHHVDLVLADVNMPVMNGVQLVERMASDAMLAQVPVVIVATQMPDARVEHLLALGARAYIAKPFRPEALRDVITQIVGAGGKAHA
jgi:two-component system, chemotaxis family, chemotaxis protein CheY